tara:strand:+ start:321 stop:548 length:228 start_codon:yes stop_codon:yes gene_type:complete
MNKDDFTIQRLHTVKDCSDYDSSGNRLVLCYRGELIPFQNTGIYLSTGTKEVFVVEFEVDGPAEGLEINDWGFNV